MMAIFPQIISHLNFFYKQFYKHILAKIYFYQTDTRFSLESLGFLFYTFEFSENYSIVCMHKNSSLLFSANKTYSYAYELYSNF